MKFFFFIFFAGLGLEALAKNKPSTLAELSLLSNSNRHRYVLSEDETGKVLRLMFEVNSEAQTKVITREQATFIKNQALRIIWNSERPPTAVPRGCTGYVQIYSGEEKSKVCSENIKATGMTYGLLNAMRGLFPN